MSMCRLHTMFKPVLMRSILAVALFPLTVITSNAVEELNPEKPLLEKFDKGYINWKIGEYVANVSAPVPAEYRGKAVNQAMGKELALRVSRTLADSVFLQIVADTRVDAKHRISQMVKNDTEIMLSGNIRGKKLIKKKWVKKDNKLWIEASYSISMRGVDGVISNVYNQAMKTRPAPSKRSDKPSAASTNSSPEVVYIDARGTGLQPALFPVILDQSGTTLLDPADAGKSYVAENGAFEYVVAKPGESFTESSLMWFVRASNADDSLPVRKRKKRKAMKATEAGGQLKSNIIVGKEDAKRIRDALANGEMGANPRIIVITDGTIGGTEGRLKTPAKLWALLSPVEYQHTSIQHINSHGK